MAELNIDPKRYPESMVRNRISKAKNELVTPEVFEDRYKDPTAQVVGRIYKVLQERLRALNAFDFDDLLLYTYLLLKSRSGGASRSIKIVSATYWWTSIRTPTMLSTRSRSCSRRSIATSWS